MLFLSIMNRVPSIGLIVIVLLHFTTGNNDCNRRSFGGSSFVCVCSVKGCDTINPIEKQTEGSYLVYTSDQKSKRFENITGHFNEGNPPKLGFFSNTVVIDIKSDEEQQEMVGFGGAFTDAATININRLKGNLKRTLLESYFGPNGIEYNMGRVPMGGTDFSDYGYSYDDSFEADPELKHFALHEEDLKYKIPTILEATEINPNIKLFTSVWTAPRWMKTNGLYTGGLLKKEFYQSWANYFVKFFDEYLKHGITFWGVSTGNEPSLAIVQSTINTVGWFPNDMKQWIADYFGPTIRNSYRDLKILTLDDQRFFLPWWPELVIKDKAAEFIDAIALHWYWDFFPASLIDYTHNKFPNLLILATESCRGDKVWESPVILGDWARAEDYAHGILQDFNHHVSSWVDWNLALNMSGGPTYIGNEVDSPIIVNENGEEFYKQPMYYALGHFSKFIPRGSHKIGLNASCKALETAAFKRPDGGIVIVLHNRKTSKQTVIVKDPRRGYINLNLTPKSISTVTFW